jgi:putative oxidoreductase
VIDAERAPYGAMLLRVSTGVLFLMHGLYLKVFVFGMAGSAKFFASMGLPGGFAWVVMLYETIGGVALILGIGVRWVALFLGLHLLVVTFFAHWASGWLFTNQGGGYEFPLFWAIACFASALIGAGAHALMPDARSASRT